MLIVFFKFFSTQDKKNKQGRETPEHPTSPRKKKKEKEKVATPEPETSEKKTKKKNKKKKKLKNEEDDDAQENTRVRFFCNLLINYLIYIFYPVSAFEESSLLKCIIILDTRIFL